MFCLLCNIPKAGSGAYLPKSSIRVCLDCFIDTVGQVPLPVGAGSLGGRFADAQTLAKSFRNEGQKKLGSTMKDLSRSAIGERLNGITDGTSNTFAEVAEAKEFAQDKLLGGMDSIKTRLNDRAGALQEKLGEKAEGLKDKLGSKGGKLFKKIEGLSGKLL